MVEVAKSPAKKPNDFINLTPAEIALRDYQNQFKKWTDWIEETQRKK